MDIKERMSLFFDNPVNSWHEHIRATGDGRLDVSDCERRVASWTKMGFDRVAVSRPAGYSPYTTPEECELANNHVKKAMDMYPELIYGMVFVNPGYVKEANYEIHRCVEELGFIGVKLYHQYFIDEPVLYPLIETCIGLDIPILMHAGTACDENDKRRQPRCSDGVNFANVAKRYPEAVFQQGHIGGGGDWQLNINALEDVPNVYLDISGSVYDAPMIEKCVKKLGASRLLFATDNSVSSSVGKILGAKISEDDKKTILEGTDFLRFFKEGK